MLHDLFLNAFWMCGTVAGVAVTVVVLKASWRYLFASPPAPPAQGIPSMIAVSKEMSRWDLRGNQEGASPTRLDEDEADAKLYKERTEEPTFPLGTVMPEVAPTPTAPVEEPPIECPKCKKHIKSKMIGTRKPTPDTLMFLEVYRCEHCGVKVSVEPLVSQ